MNLSRRATILKPSATVAVMNRAKDLQRRGIDVLSFAAGEPDFDTPQAIKQTAIDALNSGQTKYMPTLGDQETRAAIARKFTQENAIPGLTADHIAISAGGKHGLFVAVHCLIDQPRSTEQPDEVLLPVPAWVSYAPIVELAGGRIVELQTSPATDFKISPEQLRAAITPRSRLLILNSPSNPCGTMYTESELRALAGVVAQAARTIAPNLLVYSDELYEKIIYGGIPHYSIGATPEIAERTITLNGLSKAFAMTGWRIGYTVMPGEFGLRFIRAMATLQGQMTTNITSFVYPAIRTALTQCAGDVERMRLAFAGRAARIHAHLQKVPGLACPRPTGAFYVFPDVSSHFGKSTPGSPDSPARQIKNAVDFCDSLLGEARIAAVPGDDFGGCGFRHVRFSFACSEDQIDEGMRRLNGFIASLQ